MIHIEYKIKSSPTHGIGLFAGQEIKRGDVIYTTSPLLDIDISTEEFESLSNNEKKEVMYYGYFHQKTQKWHVAFDAIRVLNHATLGVANVTQDEDMLMTALRDIAEGEEILQDYAELFLPDDEHFGRIQNVKPLS